MSSTVQHKPKPAARDQVYGSELPHVTCQRLDAFRRRRQVLRVARAAGFVVLTFVVVLVIALTLDALIIQDAVRWLGGFAVYTVLFALGGWLCIRPLLQSRNLLIEARLLEQQVPSLREHLLSAVELSQPSRVQATVGVPVDSLAFRQQLQRQVARQLETVDIARLLPWRMVQYWLGAAAACGVILGLLCLFPGLHLPHRMIRILLPAADVGRVSRLAITIVEPQLNAEVVARDDIVEVRARVAGSPANVPIELEVRDSTGENSRITMERLPAEPTAIPHYASTLTARGEWVEFRCVGGGAQSAWVKLRTYPRPKVSKFSHTIELPPYAAIDARAARDASQHGNLQALVGSRVHLQLTLNQPASVAELHWQSAVANEQQPVTMLGTSNSTDTYTGSFVVEHTADYRVYLKSKQTGFTNVFSPSYRITAIEDRPPTLRWQQPTGDSLVAMSDAIVPLALSIADELPIDALRLLMRRNDSNWSETSLAEVNSGSSGQATKADLEVLQSNAVGEWKAVWKLQLDLVPYQLRPGDWLDVKLSATDRKGHNSESAEVRIWVSTTTLALEAEEAEQQRQQIADRLEILAKYEAALAAEAAEIAGQRDADAAHPQNRQVQIAEQMVEALGLAVAELLPQLEQALTSSVDAVSSVELLRLGDALASMREAMTQHWHTIALQLQQGSDNPATPQANIENKLPLLEWMQAISQQTTEVAGNYRSFATHDVLRRHAYQMSRLFAAEQALVESLQNPSPEMAVIVRQQRVVTRQLREAQRGMLDSLDAVRSESRRSLQLATEHLNQASQPAESMQENINQIELLRVARELAESLSQYKRLDQLDRGLPAAMKDAHHQLRELTASSGAAVRDLAQQTDAQRWELATSQLAYRRSLHRVAGAGNSAFAADLGDAQRAVEALKNNAESVTHRSQALQEIASAVDTLEAINACAQAGGLLAALIREERWDQDSSQAWIQAPRNWDAYAMQLSGAAEQLRRTSIPSAVIRRVAALNRHDDAVRAEQRIAARRGQAAEPQSAATELQRLAERLTSIQAELETHAAAAREQLAKFAPKISQLARQAALRTDDIQQQTRQLSQAIMRQQVPNVAARMQQVQQQVAELSAPMQSLRQALVDQADRQDLLDRQQIQLAKRADAAIDVVDRADARVAQSLDGILESVPAPQQSAELARAAEEQEKSRAALQQLAELFERDEQLAADADAARQTSLEQLEQISAELDANSGNHTPPPADAKPYAQAMQLAELAEADPQAALERLEQELKGNRPMQVEMSDIARQTALQALQGLEQATEAQHALSPELELSDPDVRAFKELLLHDLRAARALLGQLVGNQVGEAKWAAGESQYAEIERSLARQELTLRTALEQSGGVDVQQPFTQLQATITQLSTVLQAAISQFETASRELAKSQSKGIYRDGADLNNRRREMRDRQRRIQQQNVRHAQDNERSQQQALNQADGELREAEQFVQQTSMRLKRTQQAQDRQPEDPQIAQQIEDQQRQLEVARQIVKAKTFKRDELVARSQQARNELVRINTLELSLLEADNPAAQLASLLSEHAVHQSQFIVQALQDWAAAEPPVPQAAWDQLQSQQSREANVRVDVQSAADNLSRAARHEVRLDHRQHAHRLHEIAGLTQRAVDDPIRQAELTIATAREDALRADSAGQASPAATAKAIAATQLAENAIAAAAVELRSFLSQATSEDLASSQPPPLANEPPAAADPLSARQKSQLLDEIDRQLHGSSELGEKEDNAQAPPDAQSGSSNQTPDTLGEAARELAKRLSRQRQSGPMANTDIGAATESQMANVNPQGPVAVRILELEELDGSWGLLREQASEDVLETRRESLAPRFRRQVEAYFRELAEQSRSSF